MAEIEVLAREICPMCNGAKRVPARQVPGQGLRLPPYDTELCPTCGGEGEKKAWLALSKLRELLDQQPD